MPRKFTDEQGNFILAVSSSIPGVTFVPPGQTIRDAEVISQRQFDKDHAERVAKNKPQVDPRDKKITDLTDLVAKLQTDVDKIKTKQ